MTSLPTISDSDLQKHSTAASCYVTIGAKVFDVTDFLGDHPGGEDLILKYGGKDVTRIMEDQISHQHSEAAYEILDDYLVGFRPVKAGISQAAQAGGMEVLPPSPPTTPPSGAQSPSTKQWSSGLSSEEELAIPTDISEDYKKNKFLDLSKPLFPQVWRGNFSKEFYLDQVHKPRHVKGGASAPFFGNFLEPLTKTPWYVVPIVWLPWIGFGVYKASEKLPVSVVVPLFFTGIAMWTFAEYVLHRCLFHIDEHMPDHRISNILHFTLHGVHHYLPMDKLRLVMPPALFFVLATPFWYLAHFVFRDWHVATNIFSGAIFGYVIYDLTHYFLHHKQLPAWYRELKKYHLQHHYANYQLGFGVSSKFWDKVFGTELVFDGKTS